MCVCGVDALRSRRVTRGCRGKACHTTFAESVVCYTLHSDRRENQPAGRRVVWSGGKTGCGMRTEVSRPHTVFTKLCRVLLAVGNKPLFFAELLVTNQSRKPQTGSAVLKRCVSEKNGLYAMRGNTRGSLSLPTCLRGVYSAKNNENDTGMRQ